MQVKPSDLLGSLEETARRLDDEPLSLPEPGNFGTLYSAVKHFASLSPELREHAQGLIGAALERATLACKRSVNALGSDSELTERRQLLGMAVFLQSWLVREAEKLAAKALPTKAPAAVSFQSGRLREFLSGASRVPRRVLSRQACPLPRATIGPLHAGSKITVVRGRQLQTERRWPK